MSTLTPNYGLIVPENTDDITQVRADYATNLATIDNIQGGGGSVTLGMYIDTDRVITSGTYSTNFSYTATEDCYLCLQVIANANDSSVVTIDSEVVANEWSSATHTSPIILPVRKGQIVGATSSNPSTAYYFVYGVKQGTKGIFAPVIYSDNERVIGVWRDNKPLYQKTYDFSNSPISVSTNYSAVGNIDSTNLEMIVGIIGQHADGTAWDDFSADPTLNSHTKLGIRAVTGHTVSYLTIQYTKTTDVVGSGNWNTDGVPTVHYSTSEQVIGTWIDGKPLYQITVDVPNPVNDSNEHLVDLTSLAIDKCPVLNGYAVRHSGNNDITYYANSIETDGWYYFKARFDNFRDSIMYTCLFRNDSIAEMSFTIQYTKTTD